jgi:phosphomevalonate kinase
VQVQAVNRWRTNVSTQQAAQDLWEALAIVNTKIQQALSNIVQLEARDPAKFASTCQSITALPSTQWSVFSDAVVFSELAMLFKQARTMMRDMGTAAGVPIEPEQQV